MTPEQEEKLAALKSAYLANLDRIRYAKSPQERDSAIAGHVTSYIAQVGDDHEVADAFLSWLGKIADANLR